MYEVVMLTQKLVYLLYKFKPNFSILISRSLHRGGGGF